MEVCWEVSEVLNYVLHALVLWSLPVGVHVNDVLRCGPISTLVVSGTPLLSLERFSIKIRLLFTIPC